MTSESIKLGICQVDISLKMWYNKILGVKVKSL